MSTAACSTSWPAPRDVIALVKPNITIFALLTAAGGAALAPGDLGIAERLALLLGTGLIVGSANTLNMYLERDIDCLMSRTRNRPLPGKRMDPSFALGFGVAQAFVSVPLLSYGLHPMVGLLGVVALLSYVMLYTPLKQRTTMATLVGSLPGAMPPLMGWVAVTGSIDAGGLAVFGVLFLWQVPHFHAIALFRHKEYARAGLKTLPARRGPRATRITMVPYVVAQVAVSLTLQPLGVAGLAYTAVAALLGGAYLAYTLLGLRRDAGPRWAKRLFLASLAYLPILYSTLVLDALL